MGQTNNPQLALKKQKPQSMSKMFSWKGILTLSLVVSRRHLARVSLFLEISCTGAYTLRFGLTVLSMLLSGSQSHNI